MPARRAPDLTCGDLRIRPLRRRDEHDWWRLRDANRDWLAPWEASEPPGTVSRPPGFGRMIAREARAFRHRESIALVMEYRGDLAGRLVLGDAVWGAACTASLGYWIGERYAGRGITPRAVAMLADFGFRWGLHRLEIATRPENTASVRVAQKLGFRDEGLRLRHLYVNGQWRDHRVFAMTADERRLGGPWECAGGAS